MTQLVHQLVERKDAHGSFRNDACFAKHTIRGFRWPADSTNTKMSAACACFCTDQQPQAVWPPLGQAASGYQQTNAKITNAGPVLTRPNRRRVRLMRAYGDNRGARSVCKGDGPSPTNWARRAINESPASSHPLNFSGPMGQRLTKDKRQKVIRCSRRS